MFLRVMTKQRLFVGFVVLVAIVSLLYYNMNYIHQTYYGPGQWSSDRCLTELTSIKYQLNGMVNKYAEIFKIYILLKWKWKKSCLFAVVTEYKNRIDKLLTENEKQRKLDKERFKEIMESCFAMKQQSLICQVKLLQNSLFRIFCCLAVHSLLC